MPSEKAKENKTLTATCAACGTSTSTEMLHGKVLGHGRDRRIVAICEPCLAKGWSASPSASA